MPKPSSPKRKSLPTVGTADYNPDGWKLPQWAEDKILLAVGKTRVQCQIFLEDIETAILRASCREEIRNKASRAISKDSLKKSQKAVEKLYETLEQIPDAVKGYFRTEGTGFTFAMDQASELRTVITRACRRADEDLSGRGDDPNINPDILSADIAAALKKIGLKTVASRPTDTGKPSVFYVVTQVCLKLTGFGHKDPYPHLEKGLLIFSKLNNEKDSGRASCCKP
jgi:hypothetical protein